MADQPSARKLEPSDSELYSQYRNADRWAVIVGISKYQYSSLNLRYADRDAEELYQLLLTDNGGSFQSDHICKLTNEQATTGNITRALRSFLKKPAREDLVLIYFACHGSPDSDRPYDDVYLVTYDTDPNDIAGTALPMEAIDRALKGILHSEKVIILADTCHSAAISGGIGGRRSIVDDAKLMNRFLKEISQSKGGVALLTSAEVNEVSFEDTKWGGGHGVFTHFLLEGMRGAADRDHNGVVTIGELFEYVRDNVQRATDYRQHPSIGMNVYDRNMPIAIAPNANFSQTSGAYQQQYENKQGSLSSTSGQTVEENVDITFEIALTAEEMSAGIEKQIFTDDTAELKFEQSVDYTQLEDFLKVGDWRAADQETFRVMNKVKRDIGEEFPCTDLYTIDQLWLKYSKGKFGLSVQQKIWGECGSPGIKDANWEKFGNRVGWRRGILNKQWINSYDQITFNISAPAGHLPYIASEEYPPGDRYNIYHEKQLIFWNGSISRVALFPRLVVCKMCTGLWLNEADRRRIEKQQNEDASRRRMEKLKRGELF
ncbi:GUN4 domain-containing protein [Nostoc sp.]|uniref:GUN4 domain-containing protein n=1 Tax=Nostoc sp. TaxID=1180 RepID=UPI002FF5FE2D